PPVGVLQAMEPIIKEIAHKQRDEGEYNQQSDARPSTLGQQFQQIGLKPWAMQSLHGRGHEVAGGGDLLKGGGDQRDRARRQSNFGRLYNLLTPVRPPRFPPSLDPDVPGYVPKFACVFTVVIPGVEAKID